MPSPPGEVNVQDHDRRSHVGSPPPRPRERWSRPDVPRPTASARVPLPSADPMVLALDEPEPLQPVDVFELLPQAVRVDLRARLQEIAR